MNLHFELQKSNSSSLAECIQVYNGVFASDWCEDLISYFETSIHYRTDDHRKQSDQLQLIGDPRPDAIDYKNELFEKLSPYLNREGQKKHTRGEFLGDFRNASRSGKS